MLSSSNRYISQLITVRPAVSVLRIRFPRVMGTKPAACASFTSSSSKPPSGPMNTAIFCPGLTDSWLSYSLISGSFFPGDRLNIESYIPFGQPTPELLIFGVVVTALYLVCCFVRLTPKKAAPEEAA